MSRQTAQQAKPKPRGMQGGRKPKFILPHETGVEMTRVSWRIRTDIAEQIHDEAAALGISQDEYIMRKCSPAWMATLDAWRASQSANKP
jgi:hypothetical protein